MAERRIPAVTFFRDRKQRPSEWAGRESKLGRIRGGVKNWWSTLTMRASAAEYRSLPLRAHELLRDVPLYDVSSVDLPGGGSGRTIADIRTLESAAPPSHIATGAACSRLPGGSPGLWPSTGCGCPKRQAVGPRPSFVGRYRRQCQPPQLP